MKNIEHKGYSLFPIGIGTWGVGGSMEKDPNNDDQGQKDAIKYMLERGSNFFSITKLYSEGRALELASEALSESGKSREDVLLSATVYEYQHDSVESMEEELKEVLNTLGTGYIDVLVLSQYAVVKFSKEEIFGMYRRALEDRKVKYVGTTNVPTWYLKELKDEFGEKVFLHEINHNFEIRENKDMGMLDYALENGILNTIYQSIRRNRTANRNWELLLMLADKYGKTQNQIILNWLVRVGTLPFLKSSNKEHIDELFGSFDFIMEDSDFANIEAFRPPGYKTPKIDWKLDGVEPGIPIHSLSNAFDETYDNLNSTKNEN